MKKWIETEIAVSSSNVKGLSVLKVERSTSQPQTRITYSKDVSATVYMENQWKNGTLEYILIPEKSGFQESPTLWRSEVVKKDFVVVIEELQSLLSPSENLHVIEESEDYVTILFPNVTEVALLGNYLPENRDVIVDGYNLIITIHEQGFSEIIKFVHEQVIFQKENEEQKEELDPLEDDRAKNKEGEEEEVSKMEAID